MKIGSSRSRRDWPLTFAMSSHSSDKGKFWKEVHHDGVKHTHQSPPSSQLITKNSVEKASKVVIPLFLLFFLLLLLVWDMKTTSTLSEIIHDDHADRWEPMDTDVLGRWFSPLDLCMLKVDDKDEDIRSYRTTNCSELLGEQRLFCGIGSSLGKSCLAPLSTRSFFTSRLIGRMGDPDNKLLKNSLRQLAKQKKVVVFIGDVISKQNQEAMVCELLRTDRITFTGGPHAGADSTMTKFGIAWKDRPDLSLEIIFMHLAHLMDHEGHRHIRRLDDAGYDLPEMKMKPKFQSHLEINDNSSVYAQNGPSMNLIGLKSHIDKLSFRYPSGIVVIANIGVWYNSREKYRKELPTFLRWLDNLGKRKRNIILFRETAAQHWNHTVNGYFTVEENNAPLEDSSCVPIADSRGDLDWRNKDVRFIIDNEKLRHVGVVPFRDVTAPLYDMHPDGAGSRDCTRYCQFPQMWQSVWLKLNEITNNTRI